MARPARVERRFHNLLLRLRLVCQVGDRGTILGEVISRAILFFYAARSSLVRAACHRSQNTFAPETSSIGRSGAAGRSEPSSPGRGPAECYMLQYNDI